MHEKIIEKLYEKFNLSTRQGQGGMTFKYVPNEDVINRMNKIFQGNWSTKVLFRDVLDDQVILEVAVSVVDPDTQITHSHTGFGSQQIMRYNSGQNAGKIIDIGNGYKGALAKAIVNACTRWGVGLYKEENPTNEVGLPSTPSMPVMPAVNTPPATPPNPVPAPMPGTMVVETPGPAPAQPVVPVVHEAPAPVAPIPPPTLPATAAPIVPMPPPTMVVAPPAVEVPTVETTTTFVPPAHPEQPVSANLAIQQENTPAMPKIPAPDAGTSNAPPAAAAGGLDSVNISDVQKVALNGILTMNNANYDELAAEAFQVNGIAKPVPARESLSYEEAVVVIKFGNEKYRKNR